MIQNSNRLINYFNLCFTGAGVEYRIGYDAGAAMQKRNTGYDCGCI
jgi:hypothetical protein